MGIPVLIIGKSGTGKSRSMKNCVGKDFCLVKVLKKPLPFKGTIPGVATNDYNIINKAIIAGNWSKSIIIDDAGYLITDQFMDGHNSTGKGNSVYALYNDMADNFYRMLKHIVNDAPEDRIVYVIMHEDVNEFGDIKPKTIGKLLDDKVCIEGVCTIVLRAVHTDDYYFITQARDGAVSKAPDDMFESVEIPNDLLLVDNAIRNYYGIANPKNQEAKDATN